MKGEIIGYARVSSSGQSLEVQIEKLKAFGCEKVFKEKISGAEQNRPELLRCLEYIREGDSLVITKLDRMARSALHLGKIVERLQNKKVNFIVLDQDINTNNAYGKLMFNLLSSFAEFENELRKERQIEGIKKALQNGVKFGRPGKVITPELKLQIKNEIQNKKLTVRKILEKHSISRSVYYNIKNYLI